MVSFYLKRPAVTQRLLKCIAASKSTLSPSVSILRYPKRYFNNDTIDTNALKGLSKYAANWWDTEGPLKLLHTFNIIRVPFIRDSLVTVTPNTPQSTCLRGKKILEVGCGPGLLSEDLAKLGAEITGIDPCKQLLDVAIEHSALNTRLTNKPSYIHTTIDDHVKENSNKYDAVIASEVLEHINHSQRELFIGSCVKALKPGGKIIITTPNRTRISQLLGIYLVEALNVIPKGVLHYNKFSTQKEIKYWLEINDCRVELTQGYVYYFWSHKWEWITWQSLMFAIRAVKLDSLT